MADDARAPRGQIHYIDRLRVLLIILVVAHHAGQPYGSTGGAWPAADPAFSPWLGPFFMFNAAFFMGFFFFLSGLFVAGSCDRKGGLGFVRDRLVRLGLPLAFVSIFLFGTIAYLESGAEKGFTTFLFREYLGAWQVEMGPLWFLAQLLFLCILYALWRWLCGCLGFSPPVVKAPGNGMILGYALILAAAGMLIRQVHGQDEWIRIFGVIPAEMVHLPQYWSLFAIGVMAGRGCWLGDLDASLGYRWLLAGVAAFALALGLQRFPGLLPVPWGIIWGALEAFVCVGLVTGLTLIFRDHFSAPGRWIGRVAPTVYGIYIFHVFNVVGLQQALLNQPLPALVKFVIVFVVSLLATGLSVMLLRLVPGVKRVL